MTTSKRCAIRGWERYQPPWSVPGLMRYAWNGGFHPAVHAPASQDLDLPPSSLTLESCCFRVAGRDCVQICQEGDRRLQERRGATRNTSGLVGSFGTIQDDEYRQRSQGQALRFTGCPGM